MQKNSFILEKTRQALHSLSIYRNLLHDEVLSSLRKLLDAVSDPQTDRNSITNLYGEFVHKLFFAERNGLLKNYVLGRLISDENPFSFQAGHTPFLELNRFLRTAAETDLNHLQTISQLSSLDVKAALENRKDNKPLEGYWINALPDFNIPQTLKVVDFGTLNEPFNTCEHWSNCIKALSDYHYKEGYGIFTRFRAFIWKVEGSRGSFEPVGDPDPVRLSDLIGYEAERAEVIGNTLKFLHGFPSNNLLLYGDRGTGKSSTVKAILNEYYQEGLRMIEVRKEHLVYFNELIKPLKERKQKFIIFVDDLAFEDNEENFTALKAVLEGSLEKKPENVLVYATSNRRHLIKERFSDRIGLTSGSNDDEVRAADNLQEKLSLSDRFGMTIVFSSPDKEKYLEIVEGIARKRGLDVPAEQLRREALKWELWYNGRSPRTARQFVDWLEGETQRK